MLESHCYITTYHYIISFLSLHTFMTIDVHSTHLLHSLHTQTSVETLETHIPSESYLQYLIYYLDTQSSTKKTIAEWIVRLCLQIHFCQFSAATNPSQSITVCESLHGCHEHTRHKIFL